MVDYQKQYEKGIKSLKEAYGESIKFVRPGYPKKTAGLDGKGRPVPNMAEPTPPMYMPLKSEIESKNGMEIWEYCEGAPELLPNNLWKAKGKRSKTITESMTISLRNDPELAFFFYYKSPFFKVNGGGQLKIDDPAADARREGDMARAELDLNTALYSVLSDEEQLRIVAEAYGIDNAGKKHPDSLRKKLKEIVIKGEERKRSDPTARGIPEFLDELKVTDSVRLRSIIQVAEDNKKITWAGREYLVGDRALCRVPQAEQIYKKDYLCNHLLKKANLPKLKELLIDIVDREYLDKQTDSKAFTWLARIMELQHNFKESAQVRELVYECFVKE